MVAFHKFKVFGHEATLLNNKMEVSVPDEDEGTKIILRVADAILDKKLVSLRINMPSKIILVTAKDNNNLLIRAEEANNKRIMN